MQAVKETHRYRTWATRHVVPLLAEQDPRGSDMGKQLYAFAGASTAASSAAPATSA